MVKKEKAKAGGKAGGKEKAKAKASKSKTDGAVKKKKSLSKQPAQAAQPDAPPAIGGGDADTQSHRSRKESLAESTRDRDAQQFAFKPSEPEWNSETVRNAKLMSDAFSCCLVMIMEDSPQLSKYGEYLLRAVESGVRKKFSCISGAQTAERVKRLMVNTGQRDWQAQDDGYMERQDLFAEAIKHTLMNIKDTVATEIDADKISREMELAGARSKDYVRYIPHLALPMQDNIAGRDGEELGIREPPPAPPPTEIGISNAAPPHPHRKSKTNKQDAQKAATAAAAAAAASPAPIAEEVKANDDQSAAKGHIGIKTRMRKRGEVPIPEFEVIDDSPAKGPRCYVLLQGFYNPRLIDALRAIGVVVDGILLMTDETVNRYNFSIMDVEDSIPGAFRPRNVLPQYLKAMQKLMQDPETQHANVTKFWTALSEMYNSAPADSPFHDIALMNFQLPDSSRLQLDTNEGLTYFISKAFDEVAKRVYEMLVLNDWYREFNAVANVTQLHQLEPNLSRDVYEQIIGQIPAECVSVPIMLEAVVQQVAFTLEKETGSNIPLPCYEEDITAGLNMGKSSFGSTNWGLPVSKEEETGKKEDVAINPPRPAPPAAPTLLPISSLFKIPLYIKSGDYASIRCCHLNESLASKIASCQLSGDIRNIQGFLWRNVPEFNKGLYMKLLGNLNHFMFFMPPDLVRYEDMFFVLHLLMSAGVEVHLQKQAAEARRKKSTSGSTRRLSEYEATDLTDADGNFPGTNVSMEHNYLAVNNNTGLHLVIQPNSTYEMTVESLGHNPNADGKQGDAAASGAGQPNADKFTQEDMEKFLKETQNALASEATTTTALPQVKEKEGKKAKRKRSKHKKTEQAPTVVDINKVARIATGNAIDSAAEYASAIIETEEKREKELLESRKKGKKTSKKDKGKAANVVPTSEPATEVKKSSIVDGGAGDVAAPAKPRKSEWDKSPNIAEMEENIRGMTHKSVADIKPGDLPLATLTSTTIPTEEKKRFIACEEEWFQDIHDTSVIQALLECPALLAISESGALDLSKWVEKYLLSCMLDACAGEGVLLGDLKNWNYIEELVPIQTIQMLNEATHEYLSMQRMYCPFYDTLLFIFNNPGPQELTTETQFYMKLRTLPGLQHFLEYAMNDTDVLKWIEQLDSSKRLEMGESTSINTLLNIIPEESWLLVPSIKYQIMVENAQRNYALARMRSSKMDNRMSPSGLSQLSPETQQSGRMFQEQSIPGEVTTSTGAEMSEFEVAESAKIRKQAQGVTNNANNAMNKGIKFDKKNSATANTSPQKVAQVGATQQSPPHPPPLSMEGESPEEKVKTAEEKAALMAAANAIAFPEETNHDDIPLIKASLNFACYDLGKRVAVVGNDTFYIFPMDGTIVRYDISTIEPEFRMMQLTVSKNGHQTFFYPYYIPRDFDLSAEDYVICPYFHMVVSNGTIFGFQDLRTEEDAPYMKVSPKDKHQIQDLFSFEKVLFGKEVEQKLNEAALAAATAVTPEKEQESQGQDTPTDIQKKKTSVDKKDDDGQSAHRKSLQSNKSGDIRMPEQPSPEPTPPDGKKSKKGVKEKKSKRLHDKSPDTDKSNTRKLEKKSKKKLHGKNKGEDEHEDDQHPQSAVVDSDPKDHHHLQGETDVGIGNTPPTSAEGGSSNVPLPPMSEDEMGDWMYPSSENSEDELDAQNKRRLFFAPPWDDAVQVIQPLAHNFKITLPSGLLVTIDDLPGPPLLRVVKQNYIGQGSSKPVAESCRYYSMDGSVIKFLFNGCIQILNARGVTTKIDEIAANTKRDMENPSSAFGAATIVKIFNGEVILPNGQQWQVFNGKKVSKNPMFVFTSGPLSGGEIFRRRQDGVIYLHRYDGTVITHYPDGTRFTTRMIVQENPSEEFEDWVFVGLKCMIEHPNYCTVLFNTLSGNLHLKLPHGEWVRVFADGNIRIATEDDYKLDVDKYRAVLTYPPCAMGNQALPNMTVVRLWHTAVPPAVKLDGATPKTDTPGSQEQSPPVRTSLSMPPEASQLQHNIQKPHPGADLSRRRSSRRTVGERERAKSLHPKIKQRDLNVRRSRGTRISATAIVPVEASTPNAKPTPQDDGPSTQVNPEDSGVKETDGESAGLRQDTSSGDSDAKSSPSLPKTSLRDGDALSDFLNFTDEVTFCKAIDSWDNRFAMNIYGGVVVDKMDQEELKKKSTKQLIESLSEHCSMPTDYFAGILKNTSSENIAFAARRLNAYRQNYNESCGGGLPKTKIFVVKRDLTGFQFLQKTQVDDIVTKAQSSRDSMVIFDPLPKRQPRKFITIMRPVEEEEHPHGMWTRPYIEPIFRPRYVTNKHLRVANPNDLRWFGYCLSVAHGRRPRFIANAKERYQQTRESQPILERTPQTVEEEFLIRPESAVDEEEEDEGEEEFEEEHSDNNSVHSQATAAKVVAPTPEDDKKKTKKKDKKEKDKDVAKKHSKPKEKKNKRRDSVQFTSDEEVEEENDEEEEEGLEEAQKLKDEFKAKKKKYKLQELEPAIGEYPPDIEDIKGIYEMVDKDAPPIPRISVMEHRVPCNTKKAVVVRAFVEIPKIDESVQRALLAASMSYADTVKTETAIFNSYKTEDPRTADEKKAQGEYKQQLIEQNVDEMHLLEQKPGPVLRFHF